MLLTGKGRHVMSAEVVDDPARLLDILFENRGIKEDKEREAFTSEDGAWYDPFLFNDMHKAVELICRAVDSGKKILIYGDYDCDGVTATSILVRYFRSLGCDVSYIVPQREEHGYGLTENIIDKVLETSPELLITVDCGVTNCETVATLKEKGIQVIITDHHNVKEELPAADAIICAKREDNTYPFRELCGAGVALKLVEAMGRDGTHKVTPSVWRQAIEAAGIATIADLVSLTDENRTIVKKAFRSLKNPVNPGIKVMLDLLLTEGKELDETFISFNFVPRINAAGRLYDSSQALKLFLEDDPAGAKEAALELTRQNDERKQIESVVFEEAVKQVESPSRPDKWSLISMKGPIVVYGKGWHQGVLGIVAGKLSQYYRRSAIVFTDDSIEKDCVKGSGRAFGDYDLFGSLTKISDTLVNFGGHKKAAGVVVKKDRMSEFMNALEEVSSDDISDEDVTEVECELTFGMLNRDTYKTIGIFKPFGIGNKRPQFLTRGLVIGGIYPMSGGTHMRLDLISRETGETLSAVGFGMGEYLNVLTAGDVVDIVYSINEYMFRGEVTLSLHLDDIVPHVPDEFLWQKADIAENLYESGMGIDQIAKLAGSSSKEKMVPNADTLRACYTVVKESAGGGTSFADSKLLAKMVRVKTDLDITPFQLMRCLEIFEEAGLVRYKVTGGKKISYTLCPPSEGEKPKLTQTKSYMRLING